MKRRTNIFTKIVVLILLLLIPVIGLYSYSNQVSVSVVRESVKSLNFNKLTFLVKQMDVQIERLSTNAALFANDPMTLAFEFAQLSNEGEDDRQKTIRIIQDHINLQSEAYSWDSDISIYFRNAGQVVTTLRDLFEYDESNLPKEPVRGWLYVPAASGVDPAAALFEWYAYYPFAAYTQPESAKIAVKTSFSAGTLQNLLDDYKSDSRGDPFLFHPGLAPIANRSSNEAATREIVQALQKQQTLAETMSDQVIRIGGKQYLISYIRSASLGWYLVDYLPMEDVLAPITKSRNLFYGSTALLLTISVLASFVLYRNVQLPIRRLIRGAQQIKRGDYSARVQMFRGSGDFDFLFLRFNDMAKEIQELVERVHVEQIRSREALLKQLQSQINPHFLYNCLYYIKNMAKLGDTESVVAMALNLGDYFRYTTRLVNQTAVLQEELDVVYHYLTIQNLRMERIAFTIEVPDELRTMVIPRLFLQPIVENALIHGIEPQEGEGRIQIKGYRDEDGCRIVVDDNGVGMDPDAMAMLQHRIRQPEEEENASCGLWNVNKRLALLYGEGSGLMLSRSPLGGLRVEAIWKTGEATADVSDVDRG